MLGDPNPVYDPGSPRSTSGILSAARYCDLLEIDLHITPAREEYMHGWGTNGLGAKPVIGSWELTTTDAEGKSCSLDFDVIAGDSPIIIGLDIGKYCIQNNVAPVPFIYFQRPSDSTPRMFNTYVASEAGSTLCERIRVSVLPKPQERVSSLISATLLHRTSRAPKVTAKRIHRLTHAPSEQIKAVFEQAGALTDGLSEAIDTVENACGICRSSGRPAASRKISLTHVNEAFNMELQLDFGFEIVRGEKRTLLIITDAGTSFSEGGITSSRDIKAITQMLENTWVLRHGAPVAISADDEYNRKHLRAFLIAHSVTFKPRPTRRHNKTGIVERKIQTVKEIIRRMDKEITSASAEEIVSRAIFMSNFFSGTHILSSFQLVRGYQPSILGIPPSTVPPDLLHAHTEQVATRALQRAMRSRSSTFAPQQAYKPGDVIWVWYATTKGNERDEWVKAEVVHTHPHYMEAKRIVNGRHARGPHMKPAYEDVRIAPQSQLTQELMSCSLEQELGLLADGGEDSDTEHHPPNIKALMAARLSGEEHSPAIADIGTAIADGPEKTYDSLQHSRAMDIDCESSDARGPPAIPHQLESEKPRILEQIYNQIGSKQVSRGKVEFAPSWILQDAFRKEHDKNWSDAYVPVSEGAVPDNANVVRSHVVYKVKTAEDGKREMKARIVPHGNEDDDKDEVRKDSANAQLAVIRLMLSLVTFLGFMVKTADIKGAYMQSGPIQRDIYVRPPREWHYIENYSRGILWLLTKLPYGIVEAGRQWMLAVEEWMLNEAGLTRVSGVGQLFMKRTNLKHKSGKSKILLIVAKLSDDFLVAGLHAEIDAFMDALKKRFIVGRIVDGPLYHFGGCEIRMGGNGDISMSMDTYWNRVQAIHMSRTRRRMRDSLACASEILQYRSLAGILLYLGNGVLPQASLVVSLMQQRITNLTVAGLCDANEMLAELRKLKPTITYRHVENSTEVSLCTFSDVAHPRDRDYGQTGFFTGILIRNGIDGRNVFHLIDWTSHKQQRVSHSSYGAEILAGATSDDRGFYYKTAINAIANDKDYIVKHELNVDSKGLYDTITTLHEGREYRLRQTVQRIRNSFEAGETDVFRWIPGKENLADTLTKHKSALARRFNAVCTTGIMDINFGLGQGVVSENWK